ncbi:MAG: hypothetical protein JWP44_4541 [Mucilaginibacter sp.]|nr:hypothetical protein [Mucilaginibacter sp.]
MESLSQKKTTAVGIDQVRPTAYQIRSGHFVVPRVFYQAHKSALAWESSFNVVAFGKVYRDKKIDYDRRLNIRLRDTIEAGDVLRLNISDGYLHIEKT